MTSLVAFPPSADDCARDQTPRSDLCAPCAPRAWPRAGQADVGVLPRPSAVVSAGAEMMPAATAGQILHQQGSSGLDHAAPDVPGCPGVAAADETWVGDPRDSPTGLVVAASGRDWAAGAEAAPLAAAADVSGRDQVGRSAAPTAARCWSSREFHAACVRQDGTQSAEGRAGGEEGPATNGGQDSCGRGFSPCADGE